MNPNADPSTSVGRWTVIILFTGILLFAWVPTWLIVRHPKTREYFEGKLVPVIICTEIIDSESIRIKDDDGEETVRILGIDGPRSRTADIAEHLDPDREEFVSTRVLVGWLFRKRVGLHHPGEEPRRDEQGRLLAYVDIYGVDVSRKMLREGQAFASPDPHPRLALYREYEQEARDKRKGLWRKR